MKILSVNLQTGIHSFLFPYLNIICIINPNSSTYSGLFIIHQVRTTTYIYLSCVYNLWKKIGVLPRNHKHLPSFNSTYTYYVFRADISLLFFVFILLIKAHNMFDWEDLVST